MPRKNVLERYQSVSGGDMSGAITTPVTSIKFLDNVLMEFVSSGAPDGAYSVEVSADYQQDLEGNVLNAGNWVALDLSPVPNINAAGSVMIDMNQLPAPFIRAVWTPNVGSVGTLDVYITAKEI